MKVLISECRQPFAKLQVDVLAPGTEPGTMGRELATDPQHHGSTQYKKR
jgi:hypothetical protein